MIDYTLEPDEMFKPGDVPPRHIVILKYIGPGVLTSEKVEECRLAWEDAKQNQRPLALDGKSWEIKIVPDQVIIKH